MHATIATATRPTSSIASQRRAASSRSRSAASSRSSRRPSEQRLTYVYRTLGRGLVTEYDLD